MMPFTGMAQVDPSRMGGARGQVRHAFGMPPAQESAVPAPIRTALGQETLPAPAPQPLPLQASIDLPVDVSASVRALVDVLSVEADLVTTELEAVLPQMLRANPGAAKAIPIVGESYNPQQLRTQIILDARALMSIASRAMTGTLAQYLKPEEITILASIESNMSGVIETAEQYDLQPIPPGTMSLSERHTESHTRAVSEMLGKTERSIVSLEAGGIPVREPAERTGTILALLAVGAVAAAVWALAEL